MQHISIAIASSNEGIPVIKTANSSPPGRAMMSKGRKTHHDPFEVVNIEYKESTYALFCRTEGYLSLQG
ncbi:MAG TPA: hypothetical protein VJ869_09510 [Sphaerochaeta sp.]|nr:hypothetical protein [Sphaerochaeta sp.]